MPKTHQMTNTPEYHVWAAMKMRCNNPNDRGYKNYGGRGIRVCDRWMASFENFYNDVGERPSPKHSLDRIDNNGNYDPENVRWATRKQQNNNRRSNRRFTIDGETKTLTQWCNQYDVPFSRTVSRLSKGWGIEKALTYRKPGKIIPPIKICGENSLYRMVYIRITRKYLIQRKTRCNNNWETMEGYTSPYKAYPRWSKIKWLTENIAL